MLRRSEFLPALAGAVLAGVAGFAAPALAGDRAQLDVIGYSADARYFAFEEFGIQDGSGFAYTSIYIVDLDEDRWVVGTPLTLQAETENEDLHALRQQARADIAPRLADLSVERPAAPAALNGDGVPDIDRTTLNFGVPGYVLSGADPNTVIGAYQLSLEQFESESSIDCFSFMQSAPLGYALTISDFGASRVVHRDRSLPRSRGCPTGYAIYGVYLPWDATDILNAVALISVYSHGFEGADRRFVSVPLAAGF